MKTRSRLPALLEKIDEHHIRVRTTPTPADPATLVEQAQLIVWLAGAAATDAASQETAEHLAQARRQLWRVRRDAALLHIARAERHELEGAYQQCLKILRERQWSIEDDFLIGVVPS